MPSPLDPYALVGTIVRERFSVDSFVGVGRFSAVYRGRELETLAPVALRLLQVRENLTASGRTIAVERLRGLTRPMTEIAQHCPTFADVLEVGALITAQGRWLPVVVQTWLEGKPLEALLQEERVAGTPPRPLGRAVELLTPVADALAYAHARGAVHGSLAPRNVFVHRDVARVLDLGMAQALRTLQMRDHAFVETGPTPWSFATTHGAPEQFDPSLGGAGPATDVFALALLLCELLTGTPALGEGDDAQLQDVASDPAARPTPAARGLDLGDHVESVFARALAVRPADRYATVASFWDALRAAARVMGRASAPPPSRLGVGRPSRPPRAEDPNAQRATPVARVVDLPAASRRVAPPPLPETERAKARGSRPDTGSRPSYPRHELPPPRPTAPSIHEIPTPVGGVPALAAAEAEAFADRPPSVISIGKFAVEYESSPRELEPTSVDPTSIAPHVQAIEPPPPSASLLRGTPARMLALAAAFTVGAGAMSAVQYASAGDAGAQPPSAAGLARGDAPAQAAPPTCPPGMVLIPARHFFMGSDDDLPAERPSHPVSLSPYCIDLDEVTVASYQDCVHGGRCKGGPADNEWPGITKRDRKAYDPLCNARDALKRASHPMNCVDWEMASAYCATRDARLPTEAEWELAARGTDGRRYPWGDDPPTAKHLNGCGRECVAWGLMHGTPETAMYDADDGWPTTAPVASFPLGASPFGVRDMVGNVWEWTGDWYDSYRDDATLDPHGPVQGDQRVVRGGAWNAPTTDWARPTFRWRDAPSARSYGIGFRCAREAIR